MRIAVVGVGYVGLVSGACLADFGHIVTCVDTNESKIRSLLAGEMPIYEPGLKELVAENVNAERLHFTTDPKGAMESADVVFIAVGTPSRRGDGHADLSHVYSAAQQIGALIKPGAVVVTKSTVPVGTGDEVEAILSRQRTSRDFSVVSNPEFLREGAAIEDFKHPDRVVVGIEDERGREVLREVYRPLFLKETPMVFTDRRTAELIKYAANAFLAMKITFINEVSDLCERVGANVQDVAIGVGLDKRIGSKFLNVGPGYGGSCFPKDTLALIKSARDANSPLELVEATVRLNAARKQAMAQRIAESLGRDVVSKTIAVLGLTFKPNTDDIRDAPSLDIIPALLAEGARVVAFDPAGMREAKAALPGVALANSPYECAQGADALVLLTEWDQFRALDWERIKSVMKGTVVVDLRNIYPPKDMVRLGLRYVSLGRPLENKAKLN